MHVLGSVTQFLQFQCASSIALDRSLKNGVSKAPVGYLHRAVPCCCKQALPVLSAAGGPAVVSTWCCLQAHVLRPWWAGSFAWYHTDHSHMASPCPMPGQVMSLPEILLRIILIPPQPGHEWKLWSRSPHHSSAASSSGESLLLIPDLSREWQGQQSLIFRAHREFWVLYGIW